MNVQLSTRRRQEVINALRRGTVPNNGLDVLAVGLDRFTAAVDAELAAVAAGGSGFKAVRGEYGSGKTFFARWLAERAKRQGMAVAEVQISETETPLHRLETVYRRICESLQTSEFPASALRSVLDAWLYLLDQEAGDAAEAVLERRLAQVSRTTPAFAAALRGYRAALRRNDPVTAEGLVAWLGGQPQVAAAVRRAAGVRGELDHFGAFGFLQGLLTVLRDSGHPGLLVVLDEVETLQRARSDVRDKALNALRQLIDEVDSGRFPGLYLVITGTPAFFEGPQGVQRLAPLAQRLATDFTADARFDNPRAVQLRLPGFTPETLRELGVRVRDIFAADAAEPDRIARLVDDTYVADLAAALTGRLGGKVGVAPRLFLKKLIGDVLDRVDQFPDFDPRSDYALTLSTTELTEVERNAASADDVSLDLP
ncbi:BREX system ATP-binding protein BrxD [Micromonospora chersina]|uniref:BREX system ATP-binding protein BrxD n=1 Tax=Micromonospora chersina TaxID=47854 RepID=UPI003D8AE43B